jgi:DNA-binding LacI/PurR family transcriptional regulator
MQASPSALTIRELASLLGLGKTTVALALKESSLVSAATRDRVRRKAQEVGYVPNAVASAFLQQLRSRSTRPHLANLGFLVPSRGGSFVKSLLEGANERARELGYGIDVLRAKEFRSSNLMRILMARGISGIIVGPLERAAGHLSLDWGKFAVVACGYSMARPAVPRVVHNHFQGIHTAFRQCRRKGFRRIGLALSADSDLRSNRQWTGGFLGLQRTLPPADRVEPLLTPFGDFTMGRLRRWIQSEKPDVLVIHSPGCLPGLDEFLAGARRRLPCVLLSREGEEPYAGIDQQFQLSGRTLVDVVSSQILHNQSGLPSSPLLLSVEGVWIDHPSLIPERTVRRR